MANIAVARIKREFKEVMKSDEVAQCQIQVELVNDNYTELRGTILGPPDTPYDGGKFHLEIKIPETYPFNPPKVKFSTKIWHPNISSVTGAICLDILKDQWAAAMTLRTVLLSLQALLAAAEPDAPQEYTKKYKKIKFFNPKEVWTHAFRRFALNLAQIYTPKRRCADPMLSLYRVKVNVTLECPQKEAELEDKINQVKSMGFDEHKARVALSSANWNVEAATETLVNS
ncbi:ubiquitin-conjugating enzyme E2-22 kDa-like [Ruditapes philippinarum]|uniref:ubiquitin-conjugating enzyme E2-22 kDa-like n=1 Tax=Ruditapes philippinarum TaxID=129788 RepID=UPI00295B2640|nr:ubiquitin-conjugating enzyme E2-22 kDa-like [Ruditapes philippinarum]